MKPYMFTDSDGEGSYAVVWREPHKFLGRAVTIRPGVWMVTNGPKTTALEFGTREQCAEELIMMWEKTR